MSLEHLQRYKALEDFGLAGANITDDGLANLATLTLLKRLVLAETKVTAEGVRKLQAALPDCEIIWDGSGTNEKE